MLKQRFLVQFGSNMVIKVVAMIAGIVVARVAGPGVVGTLAFGMSYVSLWGFLNTTFAPAHLKLVSEGRNQGDCIATYTYLKIWITALFIVVVFFWFIFQKYFLKYKFESIEQQYVIGIYVLVTVVTQMYNIVSNSYTATLQQAKANLPNLIQNIVFNFGRIGVVLLGFRAVGLASWNLIAVIIVSPICYRLFKKLPWGTWNKELMRKYIFYGIPTILFSIVNSVLLFADKLLLTHYTNVTELGYYSAAFSIGGTFLLLSNAIGTIFFPLFSRLITENNWEQINIQIKIFQRFCTQFILPFILLLVVVSRPLLILMLGNEYEPSVISFMLISLSSYFIIIGMPYGNIINGMGKFYLNVWISLGKLAVFILALTFFVSPRYLDLGATGVAINYLLINVLSNLLYILVSNKIGKLKIDYTNSIRTIVVFLVTGILYYISHSLFSQSNWIWLIQIPLYFFVIYGILFLTGMIKTDDIRLLWNTMNPRKTMIYIKSELKNEE